MSVQPDVEHEARVAAERLGLPFLLYRDADGSQRIHPLERGRRSVTIGRRDEADISLPWDPECSRLHAELELRAGEWTISEDGLSQNGTWVNELRLIGRRRLSDGDDVRVGRTHVIFAHPGGIGIGPTLVPGELSATPRFSEQQQRILRALCRPLMGDGDGLLPAPDDEVGRSGCTSCRGASAGASSRSWRCAPGSWPPRTMPDLPVEVRAFLATKGEDGVDRELGTIPSSELGEGDVLVRVAWSSVNYKDALATIPKGQVARISPLVPGIDLAGTVVEGPGEGTEVLAHGYDIGVAHHGGYAEYARVPGDWVVPLPDGLSTTQAMAIGTAGFTAALAVSRL